MPSDLETRLRSALEVAPDEAAGGRIREKVLNDFPPSGRRRYLPLVGRIMRPAIAFGGLAVVVAIIGLLFLAAPKDPPAAPQPEQTGVEMTLRAIPNDPDASADEAGRRLGEIMDAQKDARGITGMTVTVEGDRVRVFVPRTHDVNWPRSLLFGVNAAIYDLSAPSVISDPSLRKVLEQVELPADGPEPSHYYSVTIENDSGGISRAFATAAEAGIEAGSSGGQARVARIPASIALALGTEPGRRNSIVFYALSQPIVPPEAIGAVRTRPQTLLVDIAKPAREAVAGRLAGAGDFSGLALLADPSTPQVFRLLFAGADPAGPVNPADGSLPPVKTMIFQAKSGGVDELASYLYGGGIDGSVGVEQSRRAGAPPARTGERPETLPSALEQPDVPADNPFTPQKGSELRVLEAESADGRWSMWTYLSGDGLSEMVSVVAPDGGTGSGGCPIAPDQPVVFPCGGGGDLANGGHVYGRVGQGVSSLAAKLADGSELPATIGNGFFLIIRPEGAQRATALVARNAAGTTIATESLPRWIASPGG